MGGGDSSGREARIEVSELLEDIRTAERQIAAGEGMAHEDAKARAGIYNRGVNETPGGSYGDEKPG